jgi:hypothetical protein
MISACASSSQCAQGGDELFEISQHGQADFVARGVIELQLNHAIGNPPRKCLALKGLHAGFFS